MDKLIPVYIVNLKERPDRLDHARGQFKDKNEFEIRIVNAIKHDIGAIGLFESLKLCVRDAIENNLDYFVFCEDDHAFTDNYSIDILLENLQNAQDGEFDLLLGGVSSFNNAIVYNQNLFWIERFTGLQFTIVFSRFFSKLLNIDLGFSKNIDVEMHKYTDMIFSMYPPISYQKNFPYSDVTKKNNEINVEDYYETSNKRFEKVLYIIASYKKLMEQKYLK